MFRESHEFRNEPELDTRVVEANPALTADQFDILTQGSDATVLITYATGTVQGELAPVIEARTREESPVFLLSNNPADSHGIRKTVYQAQVVIEEAGGIPLRKVNINDLDEVLSAIQEAGREGLRGQELVNLIRDKYEYQEGDEIPPSEWERKG